MNGWEGMEEMETKERWPVRGSGRRGAKSPKLPLPHLPDSNCLSVQLQLQFKLQFQFQFQLQLLTVDKPGRWCKRPEQTAYNIPKSGLFQTPSLALGQFFPPQILTLLHPSSQSYSPLTHPRWLHLSSLSRARSPSSPEAPVALARPLLLVWPKLAPTSSSSRYDTGPSACKDV